MASDQQGSDAAAGQQSDTQQRGFFSPFFAQYKSLQFYSRLLTTILQFARYVDAAGKNLRQLVWKELCQFAGRAAPLEDAFEAPDTTGQLEPFINNLLRLPSVNLVSLEIVYESFLQAQRRYPDVFCNMFYPIMDQPDRTRHPDSIWGNTIQSSLLQLNLLNSWVGTLERLSPVHRKIIWDTCKLVPTFHCVECTSFRKTIARWVQDPLQNTTSITVMFGAIAFLSYQNVLKHEFYYPNVRVPVFTKEQQPQLKSPPPSKRRHTADVAIMEAAMPRDPMMVSPSAATIAPGQQGPMQMQPTQDEALGLSVAAFQQMLESAGLTTQRAGKSLLPQQQQASSQQQQQQQQPSFQETMDIISTLRRQIAVGSNPESVSALDALITSNRQQPIGQQSDPAQLLATTQALAALRPAQQPGATNPAILGLPPPTQSGPAAVNTASALVNESLAQLMPYGPVSMGINPYLQGQGGL